MSETTIIPSHSSSCIDLVFINQPKLAVNSGTYSSLNIKCHHQITHCFSTLSGESESTKK